MTRRDDQEVRLVPVAGEQPSEQPEVPADLLEPPALLGRLAAGLGLEPAVGLDARLDEGELLVGLLVARQLVVEEPAVVLAVAFDQGIERDSPYRSGPRQGLEVGPALDPAGRAVVDARMVLEIALEARSDFPSGA